MPMKRAPPRKSRKPTGPRTKSGRHEAPEEEEEGEDADEPDADEKEEKIKDLGRKGTKRKRGTKKSRPVVEEAAVEESEESPGNGVQPLEEPALREERDDEGDEIVSMATTVDPYTAMPFDSISGRSACVFFPATFLITEYNYTGSQPPTPRTTRRTQREGGSPAFFLLPKPEVVIIRKKQPSGRSSTSNRDMTTPVDSRSNTHESGSRSVTLQSDQPRLPNRGGEGPKRKLFAIAEEADEGSVDGEASDGGGQEQDELAEDQDQEQEQEEQEEEWQEEQEDEQEEQGDDEEEEREEEGEEEVVQEDEYDDEDDRRYLNFEDERSDLDDDVYKPRSTAEEDEGSDIASYSPEQPDDNSTKRAPKNKKTNTNDSQKTVNGRATNPAHQSTNTGNNGDNDDPPAATRRKGKDPVCRLQANTHADNDDDDDDDDNDGVPGEEDDDSDEGGAAGYKPGPLPEWVKTQAMKTYQAYYDTMMALAAKAEKPHEAIFAHVNDTKADAERAPNPWNAFLAYYNAESGEEKPDDWSPQEWTTHIRDMYRQVVASRVPEEDRGDPAVIREAMSDYIEWQEDRLANYIEGQKADPAKCKRLIQTMLKPYLKLAQHSWTNHGIHVGGYALATRNNNTSMGPAIVWGVGQEYVAIRETHQVQIARYLEDMSAAYHVQQMGAAERDASVVRLYAHLRINGAEGVRGKDRRVLAKIFRYDSADAIGKELAPDSFVEMAVKHKLVVRNWPKGVAVPGAGGLTLNGLSQKALRAVVGPREEFVVKTIENRLHPKDKCHTHVRIEKWDNALTKLPIFEQRNVALVTDEEGTTVVKVEDTKAYQTALASLASDSDDDAPEPPRKKPKKRVGAKAPAALTVPSLSLYVDNDEDDSQETAKVSGPPARPVFSSMPKGGIPAPKARPPPPQQEAIVPPPARGKVPRQSPPPINLRTKPRSSAQGAPTPKPVPVQAPTTAADRVAENLARYKALRNAQVSPPPLPSKPKQSTQSTRQLDHDGEAEYRTPDLTNIRGQMRRFEREEREKHEDELRELERERERHSATEKAWADYFDVYSGAPAEPPTKKRKLGSSVPTGQARESRPVIPLPRRTSVEPHQGVPGSSRLRLTAPLNSNAIAGPSQPHASGSNAVAGRSQAVPPPTHPLLNLKTVLKPKRK
ncbi:hypothetical protein V5O48_007111 [Marasmius crinis-equi]|uniref:Uncharacterized protein n=1 Tax=Marasmius crinis-equi TaxID=585013 RepID=A0ABR3FHT2_9AGAR